MKHLIIILLAGCALQCRLSFMRKDLFDEMYKLEEHYWWHVAKRRLVKKLLEDHVDDYKSKVYLDVGCGTGKMIEEMSKWKNWKQVIGIDGSEEALKFSKMRGSTSVMMGDFEKTLPLTSESVNVISSLDVVEHVNNDKQLLAEFFRVLKNDGVVVITVPAYKWLWTYWDDMLEHKRRYRRSELEKKMVEAGFEIERVSYFYSYLLPIAMLFRVIKTIFPKKKSKSDFVAIPEWANQILLSLARWEAKVIDMISIPTGLSVVCVARKRG